MDGLDVDENSKRKMRRIDDLREHIGITED